jgi:hypothetical protein
VEKIASLKEAYNVKLIELDSSEQHYLAHVLAAVQQGHGGQLEARVLRSGVSQRFHSLRCTLDKMAMHAVLAIRGSCLQSAKKRKNLPQRCTRILNSWYEDHVSHPYPTMKQKDELAAACGIAITQVSTWFSNRRCRSNRTSGKGKKGKPTPSKHQQ